MIHVNTEPRLWISARVTWCLSDQCVPEHCFPIFNPMYFCLSDNASLNDVTRSRPWCYVRIGLNVSGSGKVSEASPEVTQGSASSCCDPGPGYICQRWFVLGSQNPLDRYVPRENVKGYLVQKQLITASAWRCTSCSLWKFHSAWDLTQQRCLKR
jgi:hypothetical protein